MNSLQERIEQTKTDLTRFINSPTCIAENGSAICYEHGEPISYNAEYLLNLLNKENILTTKDPDVYDILEAADADLRCFLCREKNTDPCCECCGVCPNI